ncbi:PglD-related sugar-binding protein [Roseimaritima sediminicola]|uniref:PglD-related sugar-binding protein n=1 Tax=Roseimaritima sediminicola TaxID=2662066 RepID=UPI001298533A|nr:hypothetical protein [Roseimaritima sediminicola]
MSRPVVIVGFGGHGRVVAAALQAAGREVLTATDLQPERHGNDPFGLRIISDTTLLQKFEPREVHLVSGVGSILPVDAPRPRRTSMRRH